MAKMTKAQARKRLTEARMKIVNVMLAENLDHSVSDMKKLYDTAGYIGRLANSSKLK